jgi:hypothetical protein
MGIFLFLIALIVFKKTKVEHSNLLNQKQLVFFQALAILNLLSIICAFYSTGLSGSMNAWYFCFLQFVFSLCVIFTCFANKLPVWVNLKYEQTVLFLLLLIFIISTKGFVSNYHANYRDLTFYRNFKNNFKSLNAQQSQLYELTKHFIKIKPDKDAVVFVNHDQKWLYDSQKFRPFAQVFLIQSLTGMCGIATVSKDQLSNSIYSVLLNIYKQGLKNPFPNLDEAKLQAKEMGFKSLININFDSDSLKVNTIKL